MVFVFDSFRKMKGAHKVLVILLHLTTWGYCQECEFVEQTITCRGIQQEEFLNRILTLAATRPTEYISNIEILDSNFSRIDYLPNPSKYIDQFRVKSLAIQNSHITNIADEALKEYAELEKLILRNNQIDSTSFASVFGGDFSLLDLNQNSITILDTNDFKNFRYPFNIYLRENIIDSIKPASELGTFDFLDLSHNNLQEFNETYLNWFFVSIDLSYNNLDTLSLDSGSTSSWRKKSSVDIRMNNIFSLGDSEFQCDELYSTSVINDSMHINDVLSLKDSTIGILNETVWDISRVYIGSGGLLDLSNASLSNISQNYFENFEINKLNLSHNNISSLEHGIFRNSRIVSTLDLSFSGLEKLSGKSFDGLSDCRYLNLSGNQFETIQDICKYTRFQSIDLSFNTFQTIDSDTFNSCTQLHTLNLSNSVIEVIEPGIFSSIPIEVIDLSSSNMTHLKAYTFANSRSIHQIDLSNNNLKILESNVFYNLSVTDIKLGSSNINYIASKAFNYLYSLRFLDLSGCGITNIEGDAFFNLPVIRKIDLHNNKLIVIRSYSFRNMRSLSLNLSWNRVEALEANAFGNLELDDLDLSSNSFSGIPFNSFSNTTIKEMLLLDNNITEPIVFDQSVKLTSLSVSLNGDFENRSISSIYLERLYLVDSSLELLKNDCFVGFPYLRVLYFNESRIASLESGALHGLYSLEYLDSSTLFNNSQILKNGTFKDLHRLKNLHLATPTLSVLEQGSLSGLLSLEMLNITGTSIATLPSDIFNETTNLRILDLSNNSLTNPVSDVLFGKLNKLTNLYLQYNGIRSIPIKLFNSSHNLEIIRLDGNSLSGLVAGVFDDLDALKVLNLSQNTNLFQQSGSYSFAALRTLKNLRTLNIDNTYITAAALDYSTLKTSFPYLESIGINNNRITCTELTNMLDYFTSKNIIYTPDNPTYDTSNLNGIACSS